MAAAIGQEEAPLSGINTTPLIDVMLVLLIMFIITIPIQTHSVPVDLPSGPPPPVEMKQDRNKLVVTESGTLLWNGQEVSRRELKPLLFRIAAMQPQPELHFEPHAEARYQVVEEVLTDIKRANIAAMGFVGNERYASF